MFTSLRVGGGQLQRSGCDLVEVVGMSVALPYSTA
jgi:hypothetical protein